MKFAVRIVLWLGAIALTIFGLLLMTGALDSSGSDAAGRGLSQAYGIFIALLGGAAVLSLVLTRFWRGFLVIGALFLSLPFVLMLLLSIGRSVEKRRNDQFTADVHSGRYNFGEHPELLAVAEAIAKNDSNAIRASAKNVRDLNAAGRDGMTLLFFAVNESLERPELASAVETLLAVGVNPNYHNDSANSFALAQSVSADIGVLRAMLDAGGDPNARDVKGQPIVFDNWFMELFKGATSTTAASHARSRNRRELDQSAPRPLQPASLLCAHGRVRTAGLCGRARTIEPQRRFQIRRR
jgi:hypothetical protein